MVHATRRPATRPSSSPRIPRRRPPRPHKSRATPGGPFRVRPELSRFDPITVRAKNVRYEVSLRPTLDENAGAVATIKSFTADRLFEGQSAKFFKIVMRLATEADAAQRHVDNGL